MRSRFTAFALGDRNHLLVSWHPDTRPDDLELDDAMRWYRLDIESTSGGSPFDTEGEVTFTAFYKTGSERGSLHERSRFGRDGGRRRRECEQPLDVPREDVGLEVHAVADRAGAEGGRRQGLRDERNFEPVPAPGPRAVLGP